MFQYAKQVITEYSEDEVPRRAAALAFYTVLSLAPLLLITISIADLAFNGAQERIVEQAADLIGERGAEVVRTVLQSTEVHESIIATIISVLMLIIGASGVFAELRSTLNEMWEVPHSRKGWLHLVIERLFSFALVLAVGFLLLVSLAASAALAAMTDTLSQYLPAALLYLIELAASLVVAILLFSLLLRYIPETHVAWKAAFIGGTLTAVLFTLGKFFIGLYIGKASVVSAYGAAGSLIVILIWVYYSAQILFIGAEITQVYAKLNHSRKN